MIRVVVDKPAYLPKARDLLHASRLDITGKLGIDKCNISADEMIPQCNKYQQMLANELNLKKNHFLHSGSVYQVWYGYYCITRNALYVCGHDMDFQFNETT